MRVMFVDDEPQILKGITRMLDVEEIVWDVETAVGGEEALAILADLEVDVMVSEMKMQGMDGAELLERVSKLSPSTVRIVLSAQSDKRTVYRAVSPMHQYLSKPCEAGQLKETIERSCSLRDILDTASSHEIIGRVSSLPSLPDIYQKVVAEIESENGSIANVGKLVSRDPAMTAKLLQLANSTMFGLRTRVSSPAQAAAMIGMDALQSLVLSVAVFKSFKKSEARGCCIESLSDHCFRVGSLAKRIADHEGLDKEIAGECFTAGLLHDVGKLVLATKTPDQFSAAIEKSKIENISTVDAEQELLGISHAGVGGYLLSLWGLPQNIVEGIAFHHRPDKCKGEKFSVPGIVYVANHIIDSNQQSDDSQARFEEFLTEMELADKYVQWLIFYDGKESSDTDMEPQVAV